MSATISTRIRAFLQTLRTRKKPRRSPTYEAFRYSFFVDPYSARDGLDIASLQQLCGRERDLAERKLIDALPDSRAIIGLGALASRRAEPQLVAIFESECAEARAARIADDREWTAHDLIVSARALWRIAPHPRYARAIIGTLQCGRCWTERMDAAAALVDLPTAETEEALTEALDDRDALVRHHAARSLLSLHGLETEVGAMNHMVYRLMAQDPERRESGRRDVVAAIESNPSPGDPPAPLRSRRRN